MKINTNSSHLYTLHRTHSSEIKSTNATSFSSALSAASDSSVKIEKADFHAMTRKEIFDWMNDQIRSGKMSLDDSTVFLGMTMKISVATGLPVDIETDMTRVNFVEKARLGIEGALFNNDPDLAKRLAAAIEVMRKYQGQPLRVDTHA